MKCSRVPNATRMAEKSWEKRKAEQEKNTASFPVPFSKKLEIYSDTGVKIPTIVFAPEITQNMNLGNMRKVAEKKVNSRIKKVQGIDMILFHRILI